MKEAARACRGVISSERRSYHRRSCGGTRNVSLIDEAALRALIATEVRKVIREELAYGTAIGSGDDYVSVKEAARIASVATETVRDWISKGSLRRYHAGRVLRVRRSELDAQLARPALSGTPETPEAAARVYLHRAGRPG
jgi:excisionase family DNA binding protein